MKKSTSFIGKLMGKSKKGVVGNFPEKDLVSMPELSIFLEKERDSFEGLQAQDVQIPNVELPELDIKMTHKDISLPDVELQSIDVKLPDVELPLLNVKSPNVEGKLTAKLPEDVLPSVDVNLPDVEIPSLIIKSPKGQGKLTAKLPEVELPSVDVKLPDVEPPSLIIKSPKGRGKLTAKLPEDVLPSVDVNLPDIELRSLNVKSPIVEGKVDITIPEVELPTLNVKPPKRKSKPADKSQKDGFISVGLETKDLQTSYVDIGMKKSTSFIGKLMGKSKKGVVGNFPEKDLVSMPELSIFLEKERDSFEGLQAQDVQIPNVELPELDIKMTHKDISLPDVELQSIDVKLPDVELPSLNLKYPKGESKEDIIFSDVELTSVYTKLPDIEMSKQQGHFDSTIPEFELPLLNVIASKGKDIILPEVDFSSVDKNATILQLPNIICLYHWVDSKPYVDLTPLRNSFNNIFLCYNKDPISSHFTTTFILFYEEVLEILDVLSSNFYLKDNETMKNDSCINKVFEEIESTVENALTMTQIPGISKTSYLTNDQNNINIKMEYLQQKIIELKKLYGTKLHSTQKCNINKRFSMIENCSKNIENCEIQFNQLKKEKLIIEEKFDKCNLLLDSLQQVIEEIHEIVSIYNQANDFNHDISKDINKLLKTAKKLENELINTNKILIIELMEKKMTDINSKELNLIDQNLNNENKNRFGQLMMDDVPDCLREEIEILTLVNNLKLYLISQNCDKTLIKKLNEAFINKKQFFETLLHLNNEWKYLNHIMNSEQTWFDEFKAFINSQENTSLLNYEKRLISNQTLISEVLIHYDKIVNLNDIINIQDHTSIEPLIKFTGIQTNNLFLLKNKLKDEENRLLAFKKEFNNYNIIKTKITSDLSTVISNSEVCNYAQINTHSNYVENIINLDNIFKMIEIAEIHLNKSFDILSLTDGQKEIDELNSIKFTCMSLKNKQDIKQIKISEENITTRLQILELSIEKPNDSIFEHTNTLDNVLREINIIENLTKNKTLIERSNLLKNQCENKLIDTTNLKLKLYFLMDKISELSNSLKHAEILLIGLETSEYKDKNSLSAARITHTNILNNLTIWQNNLSDISQNLKQLKDNLKPFKHDRKSIEAKINESEKQCKELNSKQAAISEKLENKLKYWIQADEIHKKIIIKTNTINILRNITIKSDIIDTNLEFFIKHLKEVRGEYEKENKNITTLIEKLHKKEKKRLLNEFIDSDLKQWKLIGVELKDSIESFIKASKQLQSYHNLKDSTNDWLKSKIESLETSDDVPGDTTKCFEKQKQIIEELRNMITNISDTIGLSSDDIPLTVEVEELNVKLEKVQKIIIALGDVSDKKNKISHDVEHAKQLLHDIEKSSTKNIEINNESLEELRTKLMNLSDSKKAIDKSLDRDIFDTPLNVIRSNSIVEVFQHWQQIFKETFEQYRRLSCSLLENENNNSVLELWHDYLMYVQEFLNSPMPGDYHSLTNHERLCQVHQEVLNSQLDNLTTFVNKPDIISEPSIIDKIKSLTELHNNIMTQLFKIQQEIWTRLNHWKEYRRNIKKIYEWLWKIENIHSNLNLKFVNSKRLPQLKTHINNLLSSLELENVQVNNLEQKQNILFTFCSKETEVGHRKELIAISQRINEIQASLEVWNSYLNNIEKLIKIFSKETKNIDKILQDVHLHLTQFILDCDIKSEDFVPSDKLKNNLNEIDNLKSCLNQLDLNFLSANEARDKLKDSLDPIEIRTFGQKIRFLKYHQKDLLHQLFLQTCRIEYLMYKPQEFSNRSHDFLCWTIDTDSQLKNLTKSLKDPKFVTDVIKPEFESLIKTKQQEFDWLNNTGLKLIEAESRLHPELATSTENKLKEISTKWNELKESIYKNTIELPSKILDNHKLYNDVNLLKKWIIDLNTKLTNTPIIFYDSSEESLKKELIKFDELQNIVKGKQIEYDDLKFKCNKLLETTNNSESLMLESTSNLESLLKTISISWKNIENKIEDQKNNTRSNWEDLQKITKLIDIEQKKLEQLNTIVESHKTYDALEYQSLPKTIKNIEKELQSEEEMWCNLELASSQSKYDVFIEQEIETIIKSRTSIRKKLNEIILELKKSLTLWKDFTIAHGKAIITLTQVDNKLTQLEVLDETNSTLAQISNDEFGKELGNLQILEAELHKYGELLEKANTLGLQLMKNSSPCDLKRIEEMIDEYKMLWKDISSRINKLKITCVEETSCVKKRSVNEEVQVDTLEFGKDSQIQVDTLSSEFLNKDSFQLEFLNAISNAELDLNELEAVLQNSDKNLSKNIATCQMSADLIKHLSDILKTQYGVPESNPSIVRSQELLAKHEEILTKFRTLQLNKQQDVSLTICPLCSEQNWSQFENDMWRLEHWIQSTEAKLSVNPTIPPTKIEQLEDVIQEHREVLLYMDSHRNIIKSLNVIGDHLAEHSTDTERADQIKTRLSATNARWDRVSLACTEWQTSLQTALMENEEFYDMIDELVTWLNETEQTIKTNEPIDLSEDTEVISRKFHKFKKIHKDLEKCEPRIVSLLEASDWLRQANELTRLRVPTDNDQTVIDSYTRLSHLKVRLNELINMTAEYTINLGKVLGYDISTETISTRRIYKVDDTSTVVNQFNDEESNANGGEETVLRRGYTFFGRVMRASLPFQALMLLVLGAASLLPIVDEEFSCMESNNIAWSLYPLLRYPGGPPPV
ncbi:muscle-specific protein 300 kDa-like isoform X4 [Daktulosphaira vitifoliae]|uniref:muscle-specific protein 300 kDa-like isoform X4 n=1 Tax=Daktulosphaira vitifoliae TaxID=58002 RepID=UPI0021AA6D5E|nr:muscle-specific protein 300 kDa-like isoform X4 [Daktulosphaira vitifoliae]